MTVHWQRLPTTIEPRPAKRKPTPAQMDLMKYAKRDALAIHAVLRGAGLNTRIPRSHRAVHVMGDADGGQVVVYMLDKPPDEKVSKIAGLLDDMAEALTRARRARCMPVLRTLPLALELPHWSPVPLAWADPQRLPSGSGRLGRTIDGRGERDVIVALDDKPHILFAGRTNAGKSVAMNGFVGTLALSTSPADMALHLIDPKNEDLTDLAGLPHVADFAYQSADIGRILRWFMAELDRRVEQGRGQWQRHVLVIDELATLIQLVPEAEEIFKRLGQMGRSKRLHIIAGTQKPNASEIGTILKSQFSLRMVGSMGSYTDANAAAGITGTGAERITLGSGRFALVGDDVTMVQSYYLTQPKALARTVRHAWGALPDVPQAQPVAPYGTDEIGRIAEAIAGHVAAYEAGEVAQAELVRIAHDAGALRSDYRGGKNREKLLAALERISAQT